MRISLFHSRIRRATVLIGASLLISGAAFAPTASALPVPADPVPVVLPDCFGAPYMRVTFLSDGMIVGVPTLGVIYARPGLTTLGTPGDDVIIGTSGDDVID